MIAALADDGRGLLGLVAGTLPVLDYETWNFGDSVAFEAMVACSEVLHDARWSSFAHGWFRSWATRAVPYRRLDATAPGRAMVSVFELTGDRRVLDAAIGLAEYLTARPLLHGVYATWERSPLMAPYGPGSLDARGTALLAAPPPGVFVDCLHFDPPFLTALGAATGRGDLLEVGVTQALGYVAALQEESGLFMHFVLDGVDARFGPGWGRGQGWALLGLLDVLETLSGRGHQAETPLRDAAMGLLLAMQRLQRPDGHWYAVVTDPTSGEEFSTSAFMATGFRKALRMGIVPERAVPDAVAAAGRALGAAIGGTTERGVLAEVSAAVMACTEPSHYAHVPRGFVVPWGQGPLALALVESLRPRDGA